MAEFDSGQKKLTLKLVYYGPALSGKTTNLIALHELIAPQFKGEILSLETKNDRTLFFDLLPFGFRTRSGMLVKLKLYTVPGQVAHDSTRKVVLSRADGVVFVADSQRHQAANNEQSFTSLADNCDKLGLDFSALPLVIQFNKRDLPDVISQQEVETMWAKTSWPVVFASALNRQGVTETFKLILQRVYRQIGPAYGLSENEQLDGDSFFAPLHNARDNP